MRIEQLPFAETPLGRRFRAVVTQVAAAASAARDAYSLYGSAAQGRQAVTVEAEARALVQRVVTAGLSARHFSASAKELNLGHWKPFDALHSVSPRLTAELRSQESRYGKTSSGAGMEPYAFAFGNMAQITPLFIASTQRRATSTGWVDRKIDLDTRFCRDDSHVRGIDNVRRSSMYRAPIRIGPRNKNSALSILVANAVRACVEQMDGFRSSLGELAVHGMTGFSCGELVWRPGVQLRVPAGKRQITVKSEVISSIEPVSPRNFAFDLTTDLPYLCMGPGEYVAVREPGLQKFMFVKGDGPASMLTRFRGWGWANGWLSYLGALPLEKLVIVVETFGVPTPYLQRNDAGMVTDAESEKALQVLAEIGTGRPAVIPGRLGELKHSPVPTNLAPLHAQMIGIVRSEQSKNILSSTLQTEIGGVGSYAAAGVHEGQETKIEIVDAVVQAEALRSQPFRWLCEVNASAWASAFAPYIPGGCTPLDILNELPLVEFYIGDETPKERLEVFTAAKQLGVEADPEQIREEARIRAPLPELELLEPEQPGKPAPLPAPEPPTEPLPPSPEKTP